MSHRLLLWCGIALVLLGGAVGALAAVSDHQDKGPAPSLEGPRMPAGLKAANFRLADQDGHPFEMAGTRGRVVALTFVHSKCTSTCPVTLQTIRGALDNVVDAGMDTGDVDVVAVTVDPEADTPRSVRRFLAKQRTPFVRYLVGPRAKLRGIWKSYAVAPQGSGQEDHTAFVFLIDRKGVERVGFPSTQMTPEALANDLGILLAEDA
ncbi:MAG: SCO family protein [Solirubrobacteraceae bacterium]